MVLQAHAKILLPASIRLVAGVGSAGLLLYMAAKAKSYPGLAAFLYVQHSAIVVATFAKIGADAAVQADAEKQFRLGLGGAGLLLVALALGACLMAGIGNAALCLAVFAVAAVTVQNALVVALSIRDAAYMRGAWETVWTLPVLFAYVWIRRESITEGEVSAVAGCLFLARFSARFRWLFGGPSGIKLMFPRLSKIWVFQLLNLLLFRLDQSVVSFLGARGRLVSESATIIFWAKANDLCNAVATAVGGVANREELEKRGATTAPVLRYLFPCGCVLVYALAWYILGNAAGGRFLLMGVFSLGSSCLAYEINRSSYFSMWHKRYDAILAGWLGALLVGFPLALYGVAANHSWLLPFAVLVQLVIATTFINRYAAKSGHQR